MHNLCMHAMVNAADIQWQADHSRNIAYRSGTAVTILCYGWVSLRDRIAYDRACNTIRTN